MPRVGRLAAAAGLLTLLLAAYWPALHGGFVFDDGALLIRNPLVLAADGLSRIWFSSEAIDYWPITNSSFWLEWRLWGASPTGYHATNLLLHFGSTLLVWSILRQLQVRGAFLAAALFCLHPVNVQSVAWIAQRKNTLSLFFCLLSLRWYLEFELERPVRYWLSLAAFVAAMLSKGSVAVLPAMLLVLAWWQRGTIARRDVIRALPFFAVAIALTAINIWFQHRHVETIRDLSIFARVLGAAGLVWFYLWKALVPLNLMFIYPEWRIELTNWMWWLPLAGVVLVTAALFVNRPRSAARAAGVAWACFLIALVPVMGLTDVYFMKYAPVADHYQYLAIAAVVAAVAAGVASLPRTWMNAAGAALVAGCVVLTWQHSHLFAEPESFYRQSLAANPSSWVLRNNLGVMLVDRRQDEEAIVLLRDAVRANPSLPDANINLCLATSWLRRFDDAVVDCAAALRLTPSFVDGHKLLGIALMSFGRFGEAEPELNAALTTRPDDGEAHYYKGHLLLATGRPAQALVQYDEMRRLIPNSAEAENGAGMAERDLGHVAEAERHFRAALAINPSYDEAQRNLAALLKR